MAKTQPLRLPLSFRDALGDLLQVKPPPKKAKAKKEAVRKGKAKK